MVGDNRNGGGLSGEVWAEKTMVDNDPEPSLREALKLVVEQHDHLVEQGNQLAMRHNALAKQVSEALTVHATAIALLCKLIAPHIQDGTQRMQLERVAQLLQAHVHQGDHPPSLQP